MKLASWKLLIKALWNEKNSFFERFSVAASQLADFLLLSRSFKILISIAAATAYTSSSMTVASRHHVSHLLHFHLLILLHQRAAITEAEDKTVITVIVLDVILTTHFASTDHLMNILKRAEWESATAHTLTTEEVSRVWFMRCKKERCTLSLQNEASRLSSLLVCVYRKEYMSIR